MSVPIEFRVTDSPITSARLGTLVTFDVRIMTEVIPIKRANRSYSSAMDHRSGRGTKRSKHKEFELKFTQPNADIPAIDELIDSLMDYQIATIDLTSYERYNEIVKFRMMGDEWQQEIIGCSHVRDSIICRVIE